MEVEDKPKVSNKNEVALYEKIPQTQIYSDSLAWWLEKSVDFPVLSEIARILFCI